MHMDGSFGECAGTLAPCSSLPPIAQLVEQLPLKQWVPGSIPGGRTKERELSGGQVAKLVDAPALGAGLARDGSSNLPLPTKTKDHR